MKSFIALLLTFALLISPMNAEVKKKDKKKEVPQLVNYPSTTISEYRLHGGEVVVKGHVIAQNKGDFESRVGGMSAIMRDYIIGKDKNTVIEVKDDGTFSMNLHVPYPMYVYIHPIANIYACPGDTVDITIDLTKPESEEGVSLDGTGLSGEVSRLTDKIHDAYCKFPLIEDVSEQGLDSLMRWKDVQVARLDDLVQNINAGLPELEGCSPLASDILRTSIVATHLWHICRYYNVTIGPTGYFDDENYWKNFFSFIEPREKYLLDNPLLMICADDSFFNGVGISIMCPLCKSGFEYPADYILDIATALENDSTAISGREANKVAINELRENLHLSPTDFSTQVCLLRKLFSLFNSPYKGDPDYDFDCEEMSSTMPYITNPELIRQAMFGYREYVKEHELKVVEEKPSTKGDSIFQRIIEPYKGNVLYIDFWGMGCGPCMAGMLDDREDVEANKDKPVKYLYITYNSEEDCRSFLEENNIKGEHIFISRADWAYLEEKFNFSGIPFCLLYDKQGKQRENTTIEELLGE